MTSKLSPADFDDMEARADEARGDGGPVMPVPLTPAELKRAAGLKEFDYSPFAQHLAAQRENERLAALLEETCGQLETAHKRVAELEGENGRLAGEVRRLLLLLRSHG
jgi:hypothetical protein